MRRDDRKTKSEIRNKFKGPKFKYVNGKSMVKKLTPITAGEILLEEFLKPSGLSQNQLGKAIRVPAGRINDVVLGRRGITRDTAARLAVYFGTSPDLWINLQARYDAKIAQRELVPAIAKLIRSRSQRAA
jgi:addiction module HigA family antidote